MIRRLLLICLCFLGVSTSAMAEETDLPEITVLADESLQIPLIEIARLHTATHHTAVNIWFASASRMVHAIRDGADADIVITADKEALRTLENLGQIDVYATQSIATCPLVVAVRNDERNTERDITLEVMGLSRREGQVLSLVTVTDEDRPEYAMTQSVLTRSELLKDRKLNLIGATDAREARSLMAQHSAPALLLASDVFADKSLKIVQRFPDSVTAPAVYRAAVLAGESMKESRAFIEALHTAAYRAPLEAYGLGKPPAYAGRH